MLGQSSAHFAKFLQIRRRRINLLLQQHLTRLTRGSPRVLTKALHYAVLNGGKRLRASLIYALGATYNAKLKALDPAACAMEMIHAFSLVHDDLPAMDNDTLRRGKPTCHLAFDEATAILTGDALAITAFQLLSEAQGLSYEQRTRMIQTLAAAAGAQGMAGGQYVDLHPPQYPTPTKLETMYQLKTGALLAAAVKLGAIASDIPKAHVTALEQWALQLGLAFQIQDDLLNIEGEAKKLGKNTGTDQAQHKTTYPALVGLPAAKTKITNLWRHSHKILQQLNLTHSILHQLTNYIMQRDF